MSQVSRTTLCGTCRVLHHLKSAAALYQRLEDWQKAADCFFHAANLHNLRGALRERNAAAEAWQQLRSR